MNATHWKWLVPLALVVASVVAMSPIYVGAWPPFSAGEESSTGWLADPADNICGLGDPRLLSHPSLIDYPRVLGRTPEMKKMREKDIDPNSPAGIQLKNQAMDRVRNAADRARIQGGYCSVWKHITHKDGRVVPDISAVVLTLI